MSQVFPTLRGYDGVWRDLGRWLRAFHDLDEPVDWADGGSRFLEWQKEFIRSILPRVGRVLGQPCADKLGRVVRDMVAYNSRCPSSLAVCHGDFVTHNMIVSADGIWICDFAEAMAAPREWDLVRFEVSLEDSCGGLQRELGRPSRMHRAFVAGYGEDYAVSGVALDLARLTLWLLALRPEAYRGHPLPLRHVLRVLDRARVARRFRSWACNAVARWC